MTGSDFEITTQIRLNVVSSEHAALLSRLETEAPDALLLEPREYFDAAIDGLVDSGDVQDHWPREPGTLIVAYNSEACLVAIMAWMDCDSTDAQDWFGFNTAGAYVGPHTPTFR